MVAVRLKGPISYGVKLENDQLCRRHTDKLRQCVDEQTSAHTAPPRYLPLPTVPTSLQLEGSGQLHGEYPKDLQQGCGCRTTTSC